jgi:hypothetical protein
MPRGVYDRSKRVFARSVRTGDSQAHKAIRAKGLVPTKVVGGTKLTGAFVKAKFPKFNIGALNKHLAAKAFYAVGTAVAKDLDVKLSKGGTVYTLVGIIEGQKVRIKIHVEVKHLCK